MATFSVLRALFTGRTSSLRNVSSPRLTKHIGNGNIYHHSQGVRSLSCALSIPKTHRLNLVLPVRYDYSSRLVSVSAIFRSKHFSTSSKNFNTSETESNGLKNADRESHGTKEDGNGKDSKKDSYWFGKNSWRLGLVFLGGAMISWGVGLVNIWGAPELDPDGNEIKDEYSEMNTALAYIKRTWKEMNIFKKKIQDPSREKLLPEPLSYPYFQPPYTLVLEMTGVLLHPDWTYSTGWRFKKRPAIEYFLAQVGPPLFEIVIYSAEAGVTADPLVNHLDPQGYIMYRLYRDATRYMDGHHVKDLSCLNRDMSKVIMLDCNKDSVSLQSENSLILEKWTGEDGDRVLIDLAHFLKTIGSSGVEDVRPVLEYYSKFDDPLAAFRENQRKLQEDAEARLKSTVEENKKKSWLSSFKKT